MMWISLLLGDVCHGCLTWGPVDILKERLESMGVGKIGAPHRAKTGNDLQQRINKGVIAGSLGGGNKHVL